MHPTRRIRREWRILRHLVTMAAAAIASTACGDVLILQDGRSWTGEVLSVEGDQIRFRIRVGSQGNGVTRIFHSRDVARIEYVAPVIGNAEFQAESADPERGRPHGLSPAIGPTDADLHQMLREAFELLDSGDLDAAVRALTRVLASSPPSVLAALSEESRSTRGEELASLLAQTRFAAALAADREGVPRIDRCADAEAAPLAALLRSYAAEHLQTRYAGRSLAEWLEHRSEYRSLQPDARQMVLACRQAVAAMRARLRLDPELLRAGSERQSVTRVSDELSRFAYQVSTMVGFTDPRSADAADPTLVVARRIAEQRAAAQSEASEPSAAEQEYRAPDATGTPESAPAAEDVAESQPVRERPERPEADPE